MLFKIILFLSHGCFAKTKRNLKWEGGGWEKEEAVAGYVAACLWTVPLQPKNELANKKDTNTSSSSITILRFC